MFVIKPVGASHTPLVEPVIPCLPTTDQQDRRAPRIEGVEDSHRFAATLDAKFPPGTELSEHLGYEKDGPSGRGTGNNRNGHSGKTVLTEDGAVELAIACQGEKEVLGLWIEQIEDPRFWLKVMNELRTRGVGDILIAVVDGLTGFPDAIATVFRQTAVQTCIVHPIRNFLAFVSWKDRRKLMPDLKAICRAEAAVRLDEFKAYWVSDTRQSCRPGGALGSMS